MQLCAAVCSASTVAAGHLQHTARNRELFRRHCKNVRIHFRFPSIFFHADCHSHLFACEMFAPTASLLVDDVPFDLTAYNHLMPTSRLTLSAPQDERTLKYFYYLSAYTCTQFQSTHVCYSLSSNLLKLFKKVANECQVQNEPSNSLAIASRGT